MTTNNLLKDNSIKVFSGWFSNKYISDKYFCKEYINGNLYSKSVALINNLANSGNYTFNIYKLSTKQFPDIEKDPILCFLLYCLRDVKIIPNTSFNIEVFHYIFNLISNDANMILKNIIRDFIDHYRFNITQVCGHTKICSVQDFKKDKKKINENYDITFAQKAAKKSLNADLNKSNIDKYNFIYKFYKFLKTNENNIYNDGCDFAIYSDYQRIKFCFILEKLFANYLCNKYKDNSYLKHNLHFFDSQIIYFLYLSWVKEGEKYAISPQYTMGSILHPQYIQWKIA